MEARERGDGKQCESEGSEPIEDARVAKLVFGKTLVSLPAASGLHGQRAGP
jgi:hypothetical protein